MGSVVSGFVIDKYFVHDTMRDWNSIWLSFAGYSLVIAVLFAIMFKHKHKQSELESVKGFGH